MELKLQRVDANDRRTHGDLFVNGKFQCYTLEDPVRAEKIKGKTAIPAGRYRIIINRSNRFKRDLILLLNVPNYEGVRIHAGNTVEDTEGCPLVGRKRSGDSVLESKLALNAFQPKVQAALARGEEVWIDVIDKA